VRADDAAFQTVSSGGTTPDVSSYGACGGCDGGGIQPRRRLGSTGSRADIGARYWGLRLGSASGKEEEDY
jgi:hypothetical protein